jgi:hypothetical protein
MRRLAFVAAVCGTLAVAACSDRTPTEPTTAPPEELISATCRPPTHFPIVQVSGLIVKVFPRGKLQLEALARAGAVALYWETCRKTAAQKGAVAFVNFMGANSSRLIGTQLQRNTLINLMLSGVGLPFTVPTDSPKDFGIGVFDPATTTNTLIKTNSGSALLELEPGSFDELTFIFIARKSDDFVLTDFDGNQFPPYFDYDAVNASGNHVLEDGKTAIVAFCLLDTDVQPYPESRRIGHNPVAGAPGFPFEILEAVDLAAERPDLAAVLECESFAPNTTVIGGFGQGLPGLANAAWKTARYYLAPAAKALFLPEALHATTLALIKLPPPGARTPSLSPFGVVEFTEENEEQQLQLNLEAVEKLPGGTQRFTVQSGDPGPYIWSVNGVAGGNSTFGVIVVSEDDPSSADYTAPATVPSPATFDVCARRQASPSNTACASVTIQPVPSSGADIVVFNDLNMFDNTAAADPNNLAFYANLVSYTGSGTRAANTRVLVHRGHDVRCDRFDNEECSIEGWSTFENTMRAVGSGYTVDNVDDASAPLTTIASNVKVIILALPMTPYSAAEINALKAFAGEGGRIVFVGEYEGFYGDGIGVENDFLTSMGAVMTNTGGEVDCADEAGYKVLPSTSLRSHQVTGGLTQLTIACASVLDPGPDDYPLFYDRSGESLLGAVAKVDLTPLPIILSRAVKVAPTSTQSAALSNDAAGRGIVSKVPAAAQR